MSTGYSEKNLDWELLYRKLLADVEQHVKAHENALDVAINPYCHDDSRFTEGFHAGLRSQCNKLKFILNSNTYK